MKCLSHEAGLQLLKNRTEETIVRHSLVVNRVANFIAERLVARSAILTLDSDVVDLASLLHDIAKPPAHDHEQRGADFVRNIDPGCESVAKAIEQHGMDGQPSSWEAMIVYYADKLVKHENIASIAERFRDLRERRPREVEKFDQAWPTVVQIQVKLLDALGMSEKEFLIAVQSSELHPSN